MPRLGWFAGWPSYRIFAWGLEEEGFSYDFWPIQTGTITDTTELPDGSIGYGVPSAATLSQYDVVIWSHSACLGGFYGCVGGSDSLATEGLAEYLDAGGRMILSGQNVASAGDGHPFFDNYVRADLSAYFGGSQGTGLTGVSFLDGLELEITNASLYGHANGVFSLSPDAVEPQPPRTEEEEDPSNPAESDPAALNPAISYPILNYDNGSGSAALATISCGTDYRTVFYAMGYENVGPRADVRTPAMSALLGESIDWLMQPQQPVELILSADSLDGRGAAGSTVSYAAYLINAGTQPLLIDVTTTESAWASEILSGTVPVAAPIQLPPCTRQELTVQVQIPAQALSEDRDQLVLQATVSNAGGETEAPQNSSCFRGDARMGDRVPCSSGTLLYGDRCPAGNALHPYDWRLDQRCG